MALECRRKNWGRNGIIIGNKLGDSMLYMYISPHSAHECHTGVEKRRKFEFISVTYMLKLTFYILILKVDI